MVPGHFLIETCGQADDVEVDGADSIAERATEVAFDAVVVVVRVVLLFWAVPCEIELILIVRNPNLGLAQ